MTEHIDPDRVTSDIGPFAIVPVWLLETGASGNAIRIYAMLASYADRTTGAAHPARSTLAKRLRISTDTVDRGTRELEDLGAVTVQSRYKYDSAGGAPSQTTNGYTIRFARPEGRISAEHPGRISAAAGTRPSKNQTKSNPPVSPLATRGELVPLTEVVDGPREIVAFYVDSCRALGADPPSQATGLVARHVKRLLDEGQPPDVVAAAITLLVERRLHPATLPTLILEAVAGPREILRYGRGVTTKMILDATQGMT